MATDKPAYPSWFEGDPQDYSGYEGDVASELAREGMTMLIATHEMGFARYIADRVCFLDEGRILKQGRPEKIFTAPEHPRRFLARIIEAGRL